MTIFNMDSFGDCCPDNWEEIAAFLNAVLEIHCNEDDDDIHDTANEIWEEYCCGDLKKFCNTAVYGRDRAHLQLSDKAQKCYAGIDPCMIVEYSPDEWDNHFLYQYTIAGEKSDVMTEAELNKAFEAMYDEWAEE